MYISLFDWKRAKALHGKYQNPFQKMLSPLEHIDDCSGMHYRLQLNSYRYILQKYYNVQVVAMYVVSTHPDNTDGAFVDKVPLMENETKSLMAYKHKQAKAAKYIEKEAITLVAQKRQKVVD